MASTMFRINGNLVRMKSQTVHGTVVIGGIQYRTIKLGGTWWMTENLRNAVNGSRSLNGDSSNDVVYGRYYTPSQFSSVEALLHDGWHIPSNDDIDRFVAGLVGDTVAERASSAVSVQFGGTDRAGTSVTLGGFYGTSWTRVDEYTYLWSCEAASSTSYYDLKLGLSEYNARDTGHTSTYQSIRLCRGGV